MGLGTLRHKNVLKCVPHVQHDYLSSSNQSSHCFLALVVVVAQTPWFPRNGDCYGKYSNDIKDVSTQRFVATNGNRKWAGETIVLACEMFTSCFRPWLYKVAYLRSLLYVARGKITLRLSLLYISLAYSARPKRKKGETKIKNSKYFVLYGYLIVRKNPVVEYFAFIVQYEKVE